MTNGSRRWTLSLAMLAMAVAAACTPGATAPPPIDAPARPDVPVPDPIDVGPIDAPAIMDVPETTDVPGMADVPGSDAPPELDGGDDGGPSGEPTAEERAACASIAAFAPCTMGLDEEAACVAYFVDFRTDRAEPDCLVEYDALIACIESLTACPPGSGTLCPTEFSLFADCVRRRP